MDATPAAEAHLVREVLLGFGSRPGIRLFRNNVGMARLASGGMLPFGLCPGSSDVIGWRTLPSGIAQFVALEMKSPTGRLTPEQVRFLEAVRRAGGVAAEIRSMADVAAALASALPAVAPAASPAASAPPSPDPNRN